MANRNIDTVNISIFLGDDGINTESGFADLAIADNQFPLSSTDRSHGIDRLGSGIAGLMHTFSGDNARSENLNFRGEIGFNRTKTVDRHTDTVNNPTFHGRTYRAPRRFFRFA